MSIKTQQNIRAFFSFTKAPTRKGEYFVRFRWRGEEASEIHKVPETILQTIQQIWPISYSEETDPDEIAKTIMNQCRAVGTQLTNGLVFSPKCRPKCKIRELFEKFDQYAIELNRQGGSPPELVIVTDMLELPWEVAYTPLRVDGSLEHWCQRYILCRIPQIISPEITLKEEEREIKVLVITKPSYEDYVKRDVMKYPDFPPEYKKLENTIQVLNSRKDVHIKIIPVVEVDSDLSEIQKEMAEPYDLVVFIGLYQAEVGGLKVRQLREKDHFIYTDNITPNYESRPVFFLDACYSEVTPKLEEKMDEAFTILPIRFIQEGASAFLGTFQQVEMVFAHAFARFFLSALLENELSLAGALYKARMDAYDYFTKNSSKYSSLRTSQCPIYTLYARNENIAFSIPAFKRERIVRVTWPDVLDDYYKGLEEGEAMPLEVRKIFTEGHETFHNIEQALRTKKDMPIIADMPIVSTANLIKEEPQQHVVIGSIFAPLKDDCAVFILNGEKLDSLTNNITYHAGNEISVTTFLRLILDEKGIEKDVDMYEVQDYRMLEKNLWTFIKADERFTIGTILAGESCFSMEEARKKLQESGRKVRVSSPIWIRKKATDLVKERYFRMDEKTVLESILPATLIVARRDEVEKDPLLYYSIMRTLKEFLKEVWDKLQLRANEDVYQPDIELTPRWVKDFHSKIIFLNKEIIAGAIYFTKFIKERGLLSLKDKTLLLVERPLDVDDFLPLSLPEEWTELQVEKVRVEVLKELERLRTKSKEAIEQVRLKFEKTKEYLPLALKEPLESLLKEVEQKYSRYKQEIEETNHKILLSAILTKISFLEMELKLKVAELSRQIMRKS